MSDEQLEAQASIVRGPDGRPIVIGPPVTGLPTEPEPQPFPLPYPPVNPLPPIGGPPIQPEPLPVPYPPVNPLPPIGGPPIQPEPLPAPHPPIYPMPPIGGPVPPGPLPTPLPLPNPPILPIQPGPPREPLAAVPPAADGRVRSQATVVRGPDGRPIVIGPPVTGPISPFRPLPVQPPPPMEPLGSGGSGFKVDPAALRVVSARAGEIADDLGRAVGGQAGALADVGQHGDWAIGGAVSRCAEAWEQALKDAAGKAAAVGDKLTATVGHYSTVDASNQARLSGLLSGG